MKLAGNDGSFRSLKSLIAILCSVLVLPGDTLGFAPQQTSAPDPSTATPASAPSNAPAAKLSPDQLDSLVAPIALYPDPLLAQVLAASTYPLEIVMLQQWLDGHKNLKDKELAEAVEKQSWDPTVKALAGLPQVVKRLADDVEWTDDLGNAFLAQQSEVMDAVQRMRKKAEDKGALKTTEQQKVETKVIENKSVIVIEQANPQVVYVPSYNPVVVYGAPVYAYPPIAYPVATAAISFGVGVAMGAMWSGGWGWGCGWGHGDVNVNVNNNFNRSANINRSGSVNSARGGNRVNGGSWSHNPAHRGGAPYADRATANRFGGNARGESISQRQARAQGGAGNTGFANRSSGSAVSNRTGASGLGSGSRTGGADQIGGRDLSRSGGGNRDSFSGGSRGYNGSRARSSGSQGASSFSRGGGGGGGFSRGGGGGGFSRGGGGGRRR